MGDFLIKEYDKTTENKTAAPKPHATKKLLIAGLFVVALGAAFAAGVAWNYRAHLAEIADIEQAAIEAHTKQLNALRKMCKK